MLVNILAQSLIWGRISDRFQVRRSLIIAGEALAALGTVAVWYLHTMPGSPVIAGYIIIFGLTAVELFWAMSNISWSALISDLYTELERGEIQGRLASMGGVGRMVGVWIGGMFYDGLGGQFDGWGFSQGLLFFVAAAIMAVSVIPLFLLPEGGISTQRGNLSQQNNGIDPEQREILKYFLIFLIGLALVNYGRNSIAIVFPQYLAASGGPGLDSRSLSYVLNTQSMAIICFGWCVGWLCRRLGAGVALLMGTLGATAAMVLLSTFTALPLIYAGTFLRGVGDATIMAAGYEIAAVLIPPARRARYFAWFNATFFLSFGLPATVVIGPLVDWLLAAGRPEGMAYRLAFATAGGITAMGFAVLAGLLLYLKPTVLDPLGNSK